MLVRRAGVRAGRAARLGCALLLALCGGTAARTPPLTVHLIPHSHCDPGWLESFEGYYASRVATILSSAVEQVAADPARRFVWAEMSFFMRWYEGARADERAALAAAVADGRWEFVGGGWVQSDEANPTPEATIAQLTEGHEYLLSLFGVKPRIAVQFDPFGHAAATAAIAAAAGYDALVLNRIDHKVKAALKERAAMEFVWKPYETSPALAADWSGVAAGDSVASYTNASIFTHILHTHYSAPSGFDFENPEGISISAHNVASRASVFAQEMRKRAAAYRTSHLLVPFGDDFKFLDARRQFSNMDTLIQHINEQSGADGSQLSGLVVRYSTLSEYFAAVHAEAVPSAAHASHARAEACVHASEPGVSTPAIVFPLLRALPGAGGADFFPYADNDNSWWVGYYTSRPLLKQMIQRELSTLKSAEALFAFARPWASEWADVSTRLADALLANATLQRLAALPQDVRDRALAAVPSHVRGLAAYGKYNWLSAFQRLEGARLDAALCLHHDAITGTSRQSVVDDYLARMTAGIVAARNVLTDVASLLLGGFQRLAKSPDVVTRALARLESVAAATDATAHKRLSVDAAPLTHVPHVLPVAKQLDVHVVRAERAQGGRDANAPPTVVLGPDTPAQPVVVYNPTAWTRRIPVSVMVDITPALAAQLPNQMAAWPRALVTDDAGNVLYQAQWQAVPESADLREVLEAGASNAQDVTSPAGLSHAAFLHAMKRQDWLSSSVRAELWFLADVPSYSLATYFISLAADVRVVDAERGAQRAADDAGDADMKKESLVRSLFADGVTTTVLRTHAGGDVRNRGDFRLRTARGGESAGDVLGLQTVQEDSPIHLENACYDVEVNARTGLLAAITYKHGGGGGGGDGDGSSRPVRVPLEQSFGAYHTVNSGAYLFRPLAEPVAWDVAGASVSVSSHCDASTEAGGNGESRCASMVQTVRVLTKDGLHQSIRLLDTLGWYAGQAARMSQAALASACGDPLMPDSALEVSLTVRADSNREVVTLLRTGIDVTSGSPASTSMRDNIEPPSQRGDDARASADCVTQEEGDAVPPPGAWTSDGLGVLRRAAAPVDTRAADLARYFYPLNTFTRVSGGVQGDAPARAWLTLFTAQPFATVTRATRGGGSEVQVMLHRHLAQDDGRGLATGVADKTVLTTRLSLTLGALHLGARSVECRRGASRHPDWLWTWATRAAVHHQQPVLLHADLANIREEEEVRAALLSLARDASRADAPPPSGGVQMWEHASAPPLDAATNLAAIPSVFAEPPQAVWMWTARYATRFTPALQGLWSVAPGARGDTYPADLVAACSGAAGAGAEAAADDAPAAARARRLRVDEQLCHHILMAAPAASLAAPGSAQVALTGGAHAGVAETGLPPWLHVSTLQVRDGVKDDVLLRVQNFGGPASLLSVPRLMGETAGVTFQPGNKVARTGVSTSSVRARSLTLSHHEDYAQPRALGVATLSHHRHRLAFPTARHLNPHLTSDQRASFSLALADVYTALHSPPNSVRSAVAELLTATCAGNVAERVREAAAGGGGDAAARQNTDEEGVFLSDDALKKRAEAAAAAAAAAAVGGRKLLAVEEDAEAVREMEAAAHSVVLLPPSTWRTFIVATRPATAQDAARAPSAPVTAEGAEAGMRAEAEAEDEVHDDSAAVAKHPKNEGKANLLAMIKSLVRDPEERAAMLEAVRAGGALSAAQEARLRKLNRTPTRVHDQPPPAELEAVKDKLQAAQEREQAQAAGEEGARAGAGAQEGGDALPPAVADTRPPGEAAEGDAVAAAGEGTLVDPALDPALDPAKDGERPDTFPSEDELELWQELQAAEERLLDEMDAASVDALKQAEVAALNTGSGKEVNRRSLRRTLLNALRHGLRIAHEAEHEANEEFLIVLALLGLALSAILFCYCGGLHTCLATVQRAVRQQQLEGTLPVHMATGGGAAGNAASADALAHAGGSDGSWLLTLLRGVRSNIKQLQQSGDKQS